MIFDTIDDRRPINPYTSVDCTGEETALSQCDSSLSISGVCQYLLVDCNPHTDFDPPNNENSTEDSDTESDDEDFTEETAGTGNEGDDVTTEDGTPSAKGGGSKSSSAGIIAGVVVALFILVILAAVIVLTIFLLKRKTQKINEASSMLQVNQLYDFPNTYGGTAERFLRRKT